MFKPIDSSTVLPVAKVLPILAVDKIGDTLQTPVSYTHLDVYKRQASRFVSLHLNFAVKF